MVDQPTVSADRKNNWNGRTVYTGNRRPCQLLWPEVSQPLKQVLSSTILLQKLSSWLALPTLEAATLVTLQAPYNNSVTANIGRGSVVVKPTGFRTVLLGMCFRIFLINFLLGILVLCHLDKWSEFCIAFIPLAPQILVVFFFCLVLFLQES